MSYEPPFKITAKSINLISEISANVERVKINLEKADSLKLQEAGILERLGSDKNGKWQIKAEYTLN